MTEPGRYQHGVPCWIDTWQADADSAVDFYERIFGWQAEDTMPEGVDGRHYMCRLDGRDVAAVASRPEDAPGLMRGRSAGEAEERPDSSWTTYVWVDDVDSTIARVTGSGGKVVKEPFDALDGGRIAIVADPAGAILGLWQPGQHRGADVVNEPGAWSMSRLSTDDTEAAKRFYREALGWESETFGFGEHEMTLWRVPGYVGGRPEQPVSRDVVATMGPAGENADGPPHWGIDFWIAGIDEAAERVTELGGSVLVEPYDIPALGMRQGIFADPEGATFSLTQPPALG